MYDATHKLPPLLPTQRLADVADRLRFSALKGYHRSLPIPVLTLSGLEVQFLFCPVENRPEPAGIWLGAPEYVAGVAADIGRISRLELLARLPGYSIDPATWPVQLVQDPDSPRDTDEPGLLFEHLDSLLPGFAAGDCYIQGPATNESLAFVQLFRRLCEPCLTPFYRSVGHRFLKWLEKKSGEAPIC